jgi:hypothetical protein
VRSQTRYMAPLLAAAAIGGAVILGSVAPADSLTAAEPHAMLQAAATNPTPAPAPVQPPQTVGDPQVPYGPTLGFDTNNFDGNSLAY